MKKYHFILYLGIFSAILSGAKNLSAQNMGNPSELLGEFVQIPAGTFMMGSPLNESERDSDETQHQVTLKKGFQMMKTEVTQKMWKRVMGNNPSYFKGENLPVENVSWNNTKLFIDRLNRKNDGYTYRLPTEAEWEYAARAGTTTAYFFGNNGALLSDYGWFRGNSEKKTHGVGQKNPNPWGLYDMYGNVWEWVQDWYQSSSSSQSATDPKGPNSGSLRIFRGCGWNFHAEFARSANRNGYGPDVRHNAIGFRLVRTKN